MIRFSQRRIRFLGCMLLIPLMLSTTGCLSWRTSGKEKPGEILGPPCGVVQGSYPAAVSDGNFYFYYRNPLDVNIHESRQENIHNSTVEVSGLRDHTREEELNRRIRAAHEALVAMVNPPAEAKKSTSENPLNKSIEKVFDNVEFSGNGLLSISFYRTWYKEPEEVVLKEVLNLDLEKGQELTLSDLFMENFDYVTFLNDRIKAYIRESREGGRVVFPLDEAFPGITKTQKFFLQENQLILIFDQETPNFNGAAAPVEVPIPLLDIQDKLVLNTRFAEKNKDLFAFKITEYVLLAAPHIPMHSQTTSETVGKIQVELSMYYPESVPEALVKRIESYYVRNEEILAALVKEDKEGMYLKAVALNQVGKFYVFLMDEFSHVEGNSSRHKSVYGIFTLQGEEVHLPDLFLPSADYEAVFIRHIQKDMDQWSFGGAAFEKTAEELYGEGITVALYPDGIMYGTLPITLKSGEIIPLGHVIPFDEFGLENLKLFSENP
ncbi:DUF3298 domain-containing protein [Proteiniclasticum sp. BAD-10]|uniref:DUF3298 domain-containing protein n=1 Tax=Proteiniclasticum sediminis TaxID=2804028 RepID=A0A941CNS3_9CLOT|nr:DUF3298 domain-containing protein [Proteiniclasticum sediminis]MBR0574909.1 DUF3298 domain-containing protein [Proteiniclasticum sediminis]